MTVMFTDLVGSVKMYNKVSDSVAVDLVKKLESRIQGLLPDLKGKFIKSTGDGQLLTFEEVSGSLNCAKEVHRLNAQWMHSVIRKRRPKADTAITLFAGTSAAFAAAQASAGSKRTEQRQKGMTQTLMVG